MHYLSLNLLPSTLLGYWFDERKHIEPVTKSRPASPKTFSKYIIHIIYHYNFYGAGAQWRLT